MLAHAQEIPKIEIESRLPPFAQKQKKKVTFEFRSQLEVSGFRQDDGNRDYVVKNVVGARYAYNSALRFGLFLPYRSIHKSRTSTMRDGQFHASDLVLGSEYKRFSKGYFDELFFLQSIHLPTGEETRNLTKHQGQLSNMIVANHKISSTFSYRLNEEGALYNQTTGWYLDGKRKVANYQSMISEYGELDWSPTENLTISQYFGYVHTWYMRTPTPGALVSHEAYLETAISYKMHHNASLYASYRNSSDTESVEHNWSPYRPDESTIVSALKLIY